MAVTAPLLAFEGVRKSYPDGVRDLVVLDGASFEIDAGVFVGVMGARRSGKSTLMRMAAGIEAPTAGTVRFNGRDLAGMSSIERERLLRHGIALMSVQDWSPNQNERVIDHVALSLGSHGSPVRDARYRARRVLDRVGMSGCADDLVWSLSFGERARVVLARSLAREPSLLLVDEPAMMPRLSERDAFCGLLRSLALEQNITLVVASEVMAPLHGAAVLMSIGDGELSSTEEHATVVRFPTRRASGAQPG